MSPSRRRRRALNATMPLLAGLLIQAVSTYLVLVIAGRALGEADFGALSALYVLITTVATGLFLPIEQELARRRGDERGRGTFDSRLLRNALLLALAMSGLVVGLALVGHSVTLQLLGHQAQLLVALCVALPGYACCFVSRGEFAGRQQLTRYGVQLAVEGAFRLVGAVALGIAATSGVAEYGELFAVAPWAALAVSMWGWRAKETTEEPRSETGGLAGAVGLLVASSLAAQVLINAGPLVLALLAAPSERAEVGAYLAALVIVRVPVFLFTAVQPSFLPAMAEHAAADRRADFVRLVRRVLTGCTALVGVSSLAAVLLGPFAVRVLFGFRQELSRWIFFEMTLSVGVFLLAAILAQSLLGRAEHASIVTGWLSGLAALVISVSFGANAVERASNAFLIGAVVATVVLGSLLLRSLREWRLDTEAAGTVPAS